MPATKKLFFPPLKTDIPTPEEIYPPLPKAAKKLAEDSKALSEVLRRTQRVKNHLTEILGPGHDPASEQAREQREMHVKAKAQLSECIAERDRLRIAIEDGKRNVATCEQQGALRVVDAARPAYDDLIRTFWRELLTQLSAQIITLDQATAFREKVENRLGTHAQSPRRCKISRLTYSREMMRSFDRFLGIRADVAELIAAGTLTPADMPTELRKHWGF